MSFENDPRIARDNNFQWEQLTNLIVNSKADDFYKIMEKFNKDKNRRKRNAEEMKLANSHNTSQQVDIEETRPVVKSRLRSQIDIVNATMKKFQEPVLKRKTTRTPLDFLIPRDSGTNLTPKVNRNLEWSQYGTENIRVSMSIIESESESSVDTPKSTNRSRFGNNPNPEKSSFKTSKNSEEEKKISGASYTFSKSKDSKTSISSDSYISSSSSSSEVHFRINVHDETELKETNPITIHIGDLQSATNTLNNSEENRPAPKRPKMTLNIDKVKSEMK